MSTIKIDATTSPGGINYNTFITTYITGQGASDYKFFGGTPDSAFGGTYYMNGSQLAFNYGDAAARAVLQGENIAYDFIHYGSSYGHGLSGQVDEIVFGDWIDGVTEGEQGTGAAGEIQGLDTILTISGLGLDVAPGTGNVPANTIMPLWNAFGAADADAIYDVLGGYSMRFYGSTGADTVTGSDMADTLNGRNGADVLDGGAGDDLLNGGGGHDWLAGGEGQDTLLGSAGRDTLDGGEGNDSLDGGAANDSLFGGEGDDSLAGGAGRDLLEGGDGADHFIFTTEDLWGAGPQTPDSILDFSSLQGDKIDLTGIASDLTFIGDSGWTGVAGQVRVVERADIDQTLVHIDLDGDKTSDFTIRVDGMPTLVDSDFLL